MCPYCWKLYLWNYFQISRIYLYPSVQFSSVQFSCSVVSDFATPWISARQASLSITNSRSSLRLSSIESVMPSSHLILCRPLLLLPPIPLSIKVFSNESALCISWPKYWSFSFSISPSNELISFRMDWLSDRSEVKWSEVAQLCLTLCNPVDCSLPGSSLHGILQARILEWVTTSSSWGSSWPRDQTLVSHIAGRRFNLWATNDANVSWGWSALLTQKFYFHVMSTSFSTLC